MSPRVEPRQRVRELAALMIRDGVAETLWNHPSEFGEYGEEEIQQAIELAQKLESADVLDLLEGDRG